MGRLAKLCSKNEGKLRELRAALSEWDIELLEADAYPPEDGDTYEDNARGKARFGRAVGERDAWMIGEDSGLEVAGLEGRPGVHSARFGGCRSGRAAAAGAGRRRRVGSRARYVCELVALAPDGEEVRGTGVLSGRIDREPRGSEGFGYDPIFVPDGGERTVAELGNDWKRSNSHRARAAAALLRALDGRP